MLAGRLPREVVRGMQRIAKILGDSLDNTPGQTWIVDVMEYARHAGYTVRGAPSVGSRDCAECMCPAPLGHYIFIYEADESCVMCFECVEACYILDKGRQPPALLDKYRDTGKELF